MGNNKLGIGILIGLTGAGLAGILMSASPQLPKKAFHPSDQQEVLRELYRARGQLCFPDQTNDVPEYQHPFQFDDIWPDPQRAYEQLNALGQRYKASFDPAVLQEMMSLAGRLVDGQPGNDVRFLRTYTANQWVVAGETNEHTYRPQREILDTIIEYVKNN